MLSKISIFNKKVNSKDSRIRGIIGLLVTLLITDFVIITVVFQSDRKATLHEMENVANAVHYSFYSEVDYAAQLSKGIYTSRYVDDFINTKFGSNLEYYSSFHDFFDDTLVDLVDGTNGLKYTFYLSNDTIVSGSKFQKISKVVGTKWYSDIILSENNRGLYFGYENNRKRVFFYQKLKFFDKNSDNLLLIELDYNQLVSKLKKMNYQENAYICDAEKIYLSNSAYSNVGKEFEPISSLSGIEYTSPISVYGMELEIMVQDKENNLFGLNAWWILIGFLVVLNILLTVTVIKSNTIREQEMVVARQKAELLALHSQINPHFLFNALESIRMHSLLKQERETSEMVEKLAKLQRQYTEWKEDMIAIRNELEFVDAYLVLQKYRFGERLSYKVDVDKECEELLIPKLSIVTFVENACVHGIESKNTPGWIFVRIAMNEKELIMEIEDTGSGMSEEESEELQQKMQNANIDMLKEKGRIGIVNACLRLKMMTSGDVQFSVDSEEGIGTIVTIKLPL